MKQDIAQYSERNARIIVIAPHDEKSVKDYWEKGDFPFTGISDPEGAIGKRYGQEWNLLKLGRMPALFVIDRKGMIAYTHYSKSMADIPENKQIFPVLDGLMA
jgi:peroxiredoxin Q/BCP